MLKALIIIFGIIAGLIILLFTAAWAAINKAALEEEREAEENYWMWNEEVE